LFGICDDDDDDDVSFLRFVMFLLLFVSRNFEIRAFFGIQLKLQDENLAPFVYL